MKLPKLPKLATMRKALVALAGGLAAIIALNLLHGTVLHYAVAVLAGLTVAGVYDVPNKPTA